MADAVATPCSNCANCASLLSPPAGLDLSHAEVLIEDTGIDSSRLASEPDHLIFTPSDSDGSDIDTKHHGTFIFDQISNTGSGILPASQVYVAKVAHVDPETNSVDYHVDDIVTAWKKFSMMMNGPDSPSTVIVNISAAGRPDGSLAPAAKQLQPIDPSITAGSNILIVAVAGNDSNDLVPVTKLFGSLSANGANLLLVGALTESGSFASYSNFHPQNVHVFARGDCVCGTTPFNAGTQISGTSQAAPMVAQAAAILASSHTDWPPAYVMWRLISTADILQNLHGRSLAGPINVRRSLADGFEVTFLDSNSNVKSESASAVDFDASFQQSIKSALGQTAKDFPMLRMYSPRILGDQVCFSYLRFRMEAEQTDLCVAAGSTVTITSFSGSQQLHPNQMSDVVFPMPSLQ